MITHTHTHTHTHTQPPAARRNVEVELSEVQPKVQASTAPRPFEPEPTQQFGYSYEDEKDGLCEGGMQWDSEADFPYRAEQEQDDSVLARVVRLVSSVASSGVVGRYAPLLPVQVCV